MRGKRLRFLAALSVLLSTLGIVTGDLAPVRAAGGQVLMLGSTLAGGAGSTLAQKFVAAGKTPVVVDDATWAGMTAAQFDSYDAIVLGDAACNSTPPNVAADNAATWSSVVDGNVVVIGTDETYHEGSGGGDLMEKAAAFSVAQAGKTGAYVSLSCYYHGTAAMTPVPLLSGLGTFTVTGVGCYNDAHIVATHPALAGLTDTNLSNWSCSVHEAFDTWPLDFEVLAIARGIGTSYTAPDGSTGTPYILARGVAVISDIKLSQTTDSEALGAAHTLTAAVVQADHTTPMSGAAVTFKVIAGPNAGITGGGTTDATGTASFTYAGTVAGVDTSEATFVDVAGKTQRSNRLTTTWGSGGTPPPPPPPVARIDDVRVTEGDTGVTPATFTVTLDAPAPAGGATVTASTADGTATAPSDYEARSGVQVTVPAGATSAPFTVQVKGDVVDESNETFSVNLTSPSGATIADGQATGTIVDDDRNGAFACRATALRINAGETAVANAPYAPCADGGQTVATASRSVLHVDVAAATLSAASDQTPNDLESTAPDAADNGTATSTAVKATVGALGLVNVTTTDVRSTASVRCSPGAGGLVPVLTSSSSIGSLKVNGITVTVLGSGAVSLPLGLGTVQFNRTVSTPTSVTRQAVRIVLLGQEVVIGESRAGFSGNPCAQ